MPGMNSGININDPTVTAAFRAALAHQGLIALAIVVLIALLWTASKAWLPPRAEAADDGRGPGLAWSAEPAGRRLLRIGFGLLWVFDGILQAQPAMAAGLPSQVIQPTAASSPGWVQHLVNWGGTTWSYHPIQAGAASVWIQVGIGIWLLVAPVGLWSRAAGLVERGLGAGGLGIRRVVRRDLRARAELAVRRARGGAVLLRGGCPGRAAAHGLAHAAARPRRAGRDGRLLPGDGGAPGVAGARVLAGYFRSSAWLAGGHDPVDGPDEPAVGHRRLGQRVHGVRRGARIRREPVRGDRARGDRAGHGHGLAPGAVPRRRRDRGALPGDLGARPGLRLLRRSGHRPEQHDPDGAGDRRRLPGADPGPGGRGRGRPESAHDAAAESAAAAAEPAAAARGAGGSGRGAGGRPGTGGARADRWLAGAAAPRGAVPVVRDRDRQLGRLSECPGRRYPRGRPDGGGASEHRRVDDPGPVAVRFCSADGLSQPKTSSSRTRTAAR